MMQKSLFVKQATPRAEAGSPKFDQAKADVYFKAVVDKMTGLGPILFT